MRAVVGAFVRGAEHVHRHRAEAAEVASRYIGVGAEIIRRAFDSNLPDVRALHHTKAMDGVLALMADLGYVNGKPRGFTDLSFLDEALAASARA